MNIGKEGKPVVDDRMWVCDLETMRWISLRPNSVSPPLRQGHSIVSMSNTLLIFGGLDSDGQALDDLWLYDTERNAWAEVERKDRWPSARSGHATTILQNRWMVVSGGIYMDSSGNAAVQSDIWVFDCCKYTIFKCVFYLTIISGTQMDRD